MTEQGDYDRAGGRRQSRGTTTEQGDYDRAGGRRQSRVIMTEQGDYDRAGAVSYTHLTLPTSVAV